MPQDGSNNYQYPPGTRGVPDQTIESEAYNTFLDDLVVNDLNIPRPIHRGGTGATTATSAIFNLGGERAAAVVTNYDSHVWMPGSFYSAIGATNAPVAGRAFVGIAYSSDPPAEPPANLNVIIEARDQNDTTVPGRVHIREKKAGVWGVWKGEDRLGVQTTPPSTVNSPDGALWWDNDNGVLYVNYNDGNTTQWVQAVALPQIDTTVYVAKAGDTMTGRLTLSDDPLNDLHAVSKRYVDGGVGGLSSGKVSRSGDSMTGFLTLHADPDAALKAATKQYVDAAANAVSIAAAPLDALAYSGMQINGSMEISQERGGTATTANNAYVVDGWQHVFFGTMVLTSGYTVASIAPGFPAQLFVVAGTAQTTIGANDIAFVYQKIEGIRAARLAWGTASAKPITIAFWSWHHRIGVYSVAVRNAASNRSYVATYTHTVADTAQYNVITVPGDTAGVWPADNTAALVISFGLALGSTYTAPAANTWYGANYIAAPGQVNGVGATTDVHRYTGVIILPGIYAPTAAQSPLIMRPFDQELVTCQRYFETHRTEAVYAFIPALQNASSSYYTSTWYFSVKKRASPTFSLKGGLWTPAVVAPTPGTDAVVFESGSGPFVLTQTAGVVSAIADARL